MKSFIDYHLRLCDSQRTLNGRLFLLAFAVTAAILFLTYRHRPIILVANVLIAFAVYRYAAGRSHRIWLMRRKKWEDLELVLKLRDEFTSVAFQSASLVKSEDTSPGMPQLQPI